MMILRQYTEEDRPLKFSEWKIKVNEVLEPYGGSICHWYFPEDATEIKISIYWGEMASTRHIFDTDPVGFALEALRYYAERMHAIGCSEWDGGK